MADMVRGRNPSQKTLPDEVIEYMVMCETGLDIDKIRDMKVRDRKCLNIMAQFTFNAKLQKGLA